MKNLADALFARGAMRKFISVKCVAIGTRMMNCMMAGAKSACVKQSTMTHFLSTAKRTRTNIILKAL